MRLNKNHPLYQEDLKSIFTVDGIDSLHGKRILVTGATGLIGVYLIDTLMLIGDVIVYAVGRSKEKAFSRLGEYYDNPNFFFIEQNVCQPFSDDIMVDYIIPGASNTHPHAYSLYPIETIMTNIKGVEHALNLAERCGATVLYLSSVEVYGNAVGQESFSEDYTGRLNLANSRSCYPESKRLCEAMCQSYIAEKGVKVKIVRLSRIFGPTMQESDSKASSQFIKNTIADKDIVLKSKGDQFFSYTYVSDAVAAILYVMINGAIGQAYNISSPNCNIRLRDFASLCAKCNGRNIISVYPEESEQMGYSIASHAILDNSKLQSIGFESKYSMNEAVIRTVEILKNG